MIVSLYLTIFYVVSQTARRQIGSSIKFNFVLKNIYVTPANHLSILCFVCLMFQKIFLLTKQTGEK